MNRATHPDHTVLTTYDELGNVVSVTDQLGRTTTYEYDNLGRQTKETLPDPDGPGSPLLAPETTFAYDAAGNLTSVTDPEDNTTWYVYDELHRQVRTVDALGTGPGDPDHATVTTYDAVGKVTSVTDPEDNATTYEFDRLDRLTSETNELDDARSFDYNAAGDIVRQTDRNDRVTEYVYDAVGRLTEERWLDGSEEVVHTIHRVYDDAGQLTGVVETDEDDLLTGVRYQYVYDSLGNVVSARMAPGDLTQTEITQFTASLDQWDDKLDWDDDGDDEQYERNYFAYQWDTGDVVRVNMHSDEFDPVLIATTDWEPENWLLDDNSGPGNDAYLEFTVGEDTAWYILRTSHDEIPTTDFNYYDYDLDLRVDVIDPFLFPTHLVEFEYTYDLAGNVIEATDSEGGLTEYDYDDLHRVTQTRQSGTGVAEKRVDFVYYDDGQFDTVTRYSDLAGTNEVAQNTYSYDGIGRLTDLVHDYGATQLEYGYTYDAAGRITDTTLPDGTASFTYDATDQLLDADHNYQTDEGYTYDANGNRTNTGYETGDANRLESDGTYNYSYDAEGNRTARFVDNDSNGQLTTGDTVVTEYEWDYRNRLVKVTDRATAGGSATQVVEYTYDYLNRRVGRTLDSDGDGMPEEYTYQVHRGDEVALEFTDPDGLEDDTTQATVSHRYLYGVAVDQILAVEDDAGDVLWGLGDHQGTIRDVIDSSGNLDTHVEYDSFGRITGGTAASADFLFAYTGRPIDPDTGLYNYRARWYDPEVGRFVSEDPIAFGGGDANLYRYVGNSPVIYVDPSGLGYTGFSDPSWYQPMYQPSDPPSYNPYGYGPWEPPPDDDEVEEPELAPDPEMMPPPDPDGGEVEEPDLVPPRNVRLPPPIVPHPPMPVVRALPGGQMPWPTTSELREGMSAWERFKRTFTRTRVVVFAEWAWGHGVVEALAPVLPCGNTLVTQKNAADERARASQVYENARDAGYSPAGAAGLGTAMVAADMTGVTNASYLVPGINNDHDPVTGERVSTGQQWLNGVLGLTQLGLVGYGLTKTFVSPRLAPARGYVIPEVVAEGSPTAAMEPSTLRVGPYARESIPADGPIVTAVKRAQINKIGSQRGCHTCGTKNPGTPLGNFIADHQPPSAMTLPGQSQRLYPHCARCSARQGGQVRAWQQ